MFIYVSLQNPVAALPCRNLEKQSDSKSQTPRIVSIIALIKIPARSQIPNTEAVIFSQWPEKQLSSVGSLIIFPPTTKIAT